MATVLRGASGLSLAGAKSPARGGRIGTFRGCLMTVQNGMPLFKEVPSSVTFQGRVVACRVRLFSFWQSSAPGGYLLNPHLMLSNKSLATETSPVVIHIYFVPGGDCGLKCNSSNRARRFLALLMKSKMFLKMTFFICSKPVFKSFKR